MDGGHPSGFNPDAKPALVDLRQAEYRQVQDHDASRTQQQIADAQNNEEVGHGAAGDKQAGQQAGQGCRHGEPEKGMKAKHQRSCQRHAGTKGCKHFCEIRHNENGKQCEARRRDHRQGRADEKGNRISLLPADGDLLIFFKPAVSLR